MTVRYEGVDPNEHVNADVHLEAGGDHGAGEASRVDSPKKRALSLIRQLRLLDLGAAERVALLDELERAIDSLS